MQIDFLLAQTMNTPDGGGEQKRKAEISGKVIVIVEDELPMMDPVASTPIFCPLMNFRRVANLPLAAATIKKAAPPSALARNDTAISIQNRPRKMTTRMTAAVNSTGINCSPAHGTTRQTTKRHAKRVRLPLIDINQSTTVISKAPKPS